jgi:hypothetical protein
MQALFNIFLLSLIVAVGVSISTAKLIELLAWRIKSAVYRKSKLASAAKEYVVAHQ